MYYAYRYTHCTRAHSSREKNGCVKNTVTLRWHGFLPAFVSTLAGAEVVTKKSWFFFFFGKSFSVKNMWHLLWRFLLLLRVHLVTRIFTRPSASCHYFVISILDGTSSTLLLSPRFDRKIKKAWFHLFGISPTCTVVRFFMHSVPFVIKEIKKKK